MSSHHRHSSPHLPVHRYRKSRRFESLEHRTLLSANVLNYHNDPLSTGANLAETTLTPANVNATQFGKLATTPLDGQTYAQPLYMENVAISTAQASGTYNVVFAATEHDSVYAIDSATGNVLWQTSFIDPTKGVTSVPSSDVGCNDITPEIGITSTPVIDPTTNTLYVVATTKEVRADGNHYVWKLHALDLATGLEQDHTPLTIGDTLYDGTNFTFASGPSVAGTGAGAVNGMVTFNAARELERAGLTLDTNGNIYMAFGSYSETAPAHGWVMAAKMTPTGQSVWAAVNLTPNGSLGDVWQAGNAITADKGFYVSTGNGTFDTTFNASGFPVNADYGDSLVKLIFDPNGITGPNANGYGLKVIDYFTPYNQQALDAQQLDPGSGGILLLPDSAGSAAHPHLMIQGGEQGTLYLMDRDLMAGYHAGGPNLTLQEISDPTGGTQPAFFNTPAYYNNTIYLAGSNGQLTALPISNAVVGGASSQSPDSFGPRGAVPSISANATADGIVWAIDQATNQLRAYNAADLSDELYTSDQAAGGADALGPAVKFSVPTIADGQVFVGTTNSLVIYGAVSNRGNGGGGGQGGGGGEGGGGEGNGEGSGTGNNGQTQTPLERYISAAYLDALGRAVDAPALSGWNNLLRGGLSRLVFTEALTHSDEYYHLVIQAAYQRYLHRAPDAHGLAFWTGQMRDGLSDELLEADLIASDEYFAQAGGSDRGWIDAVYQDLLGRAPDRQGESDWLAALAHGMTRLQAAAGFTESAEREAERIGDDYNQFLGRDAAAAEVAGWVRLFENGAHNEDIVAGFLASGEYLNAHE